MTDKIITHVIDAKKRVTTPFKDKPKFLQTVEIFANRSQELEDIIYDLIEGVRLDDIEGINIDDIYGNLLGFARNGLSDADYKTTLLVVVTVLRSKGEGDRLNAVLKALTKSTAVLNREYFPASVILTANTAPTLSKSLVKELMQKTKGGGIKLYVIIAASGAFRFSSVSHHVVGSTTGFGEYGLTGIGGIFAYIL